jgi:hypothetical protein
LFGIGLMMWIPPLVQQLDGRPGNLSQIWRFFSSSHGHPTVAFAVALTGTAASSALGFASPQLRLDARPGQHEFALLVVLLLVVTVVGGLIRRSILPVALVAGLGLCAAVMGASQLVGMPWEYLLTWTTAPVIVAAIAAAVTLSSLPGRAVGALIVVLCCAGIALATTSAVRRSPQLNSRDATVASTALVKNIPAGHTIGLIGYDLAPLLDIDGVADYLSSQGRSFDVPNYYRFEFPSLAAHPAYWAVLASIPGEIPRGYRVVAHTPDLYVAFGTTEPPGWN